jgi:hypothetical protein
MDTFEIQLFNWGENDVMQLADDIRDNMKALEKSSTEFPQRLEFSRKFIVCVGRGGGHATLFVGPIFIREPKKEPRYYHSDLVQSARKLGNTNLVSGGGEIFFTKAEPGWSAVFGNYSERYGVFTPTLLLHRHTVAQWLDMPVKFVWQETIRISVENSA